MKIALPLLLVALAGQCSAAEPTYSKQYDSCMDKADGVTSNMLACIRAETAKQDAKLNANYKAALTATPAPRQAKLRDAQRNWIKFRDTSCDFLNDPDGGTAAGVDAAECVMSTTAERAQSLGDFAEMMSTR